MNNIPDYIVYTLKMHKNTIITKEALKRVGKKELLNYLKSKGLECRIRKSEPQSLEFEKSKLIYDHYIIEVK